MIARQAEPPERTRKERFHGPDFPEFRCRRSHRIRFPDDCDISAPERRPLNAESAGQSPHTTASECLTAALNRPETMGMAGNESSRNPEN